MGFAGDDPAEEGVPYGDGGAAAAAAGDSGQPADGDSARGQHRRPVHRLPSHR